METTRKELVPESIAQFLYSKDVNLLNVEQRAYFLYNFNIGNYPYMSIKAKEFIRNNEPSFVRAVMNGCVGGVPKVIRVGDYYFNGSLEEFSLTRAVHKATLFYDSKYIDEILRVLKDVYTEEVE